jgi:hypothetical protein
MRDRETSDTRTSTAAQAAHSPGPWTADIPQPVHKEHYATGTGADIWSADPFNDKLSRIAFIPVISNNWKANARLIAAAPDMLSALRECTLQLQYLADKFGETGTGATVLARVNAAIAKATGA